MSFLNVSDMIVLGKYFLKKSLMTWMQLGISHDSHKYRATLKFILVDAFCMKE